MNSKLMKRLVRNAFSMILSLIVYHSSSAQITLVDRGSSAYSILLAEIPSALEVKAAAVLQDYIHRVTDCKLTIINESPGTPKDKKGFGKVISVGNTTLAKKYLVDLPTEGFLIEQRQHALIMQGTAKGILYAAYSFVEEILGCRKWYANEPAVCTQQSKVLIPNLYRRKEIPAFTYREIYSPVQIDQEYVDWHRIHLLDELWGLWGHSFDRLVPSATYFKSHPEYFSFFNGTRQPNQLCLSNPEVLEIAVKAVEHAIHEQPQATFWSISPNDDPVYCECDACKKMDDQQGGPQGSLIHFVNQVASRFPEQQFTTLAYGPTAKSTQSLKPVDNLTIFLSNIDADRTFPIVSERSANAFRSQLSGWFNQTNKVFIWDYYTQFTNYLAPFPNLYTIKENMQYYKQNKVLGIFAQSSGSSYSEMAELKSYVLAKLLWNPDLNVDSIESEFLKGYYGKASVAVKDYLMALHDNSRQESLSIYGNPIHHYTGYLSLENMDKYSTLMDQAEKAVEGEDLFQQRITRLRLSQEYVYLQQAKFYGIEPHGIFQQNTLGDWSINDRLQKRITEFTKNAIHSHVTEISEGGMSPQEYQKEWDQILESKVRNNLATNAVVFNTKYDFDPSFGGKGWRTLVDGNPGYNDFSYNWLCFYGKPMELSLDLRQQKAVDKVSLNFLVDPRHWIFAPKNVEVWVSRDGFDFHKIGTKDFTNHQLEDYEIKRADLSFTNTIEGIRYIKLIAEPIQELPKFRYHKTKKPMMACDEIWVE